MSKFSGHCDVDTDKIQYRNSRTHSCQLHRHPNVGALSDKEDHMLSAVWLKAMIAKDMGHTQDTENELERLVSLDSTISNVDEAQKELDVLMLELEKLRA